MQHFDDVDLVSLQCAGGLRLLIAEKSGKNQPWNALQPWQNVEKKSARQIGRNNVDLAAVALAKAALARRFPPAHIGKSKMHIVDLVVTRVPFRRRDGDWVIIDSDHALRA